MSERVAIVGSRGYQPLEDVRAYVRALPTGTVVVSGGAHGVDRTAAQEAARCNLSCVEHRPDYETHGKRAPLVRNRLIAQDCDRMVAFWDGKSSGTAHAIDCANKLDKPVEVR